MNEKENVQKTTKEKKNTTPMTDEKRRRINRLIDKLVELGFIVITNEQPESVPALTANGKNE